MPTPLCSTKDIYITPYWNTIHKEYLLLRYNFGETGDHPIYATWDAISQMPIRNIDYLFECTFQLNLAVFGLDGHFLPIINFNNDKFQWLFYRLDNNNKVIQIQGYSHYSGITQFGEDVEDLLAFNHIHYSKASTTKAFQGQFLTIQKDESIPSLKNLSQKEVDAYMATQEFDDELDDINDPMDYFISFEDEKPKPQNDSYKLMSIYDYKCPLKEYFGAIPNRKQNGFEIPLIDGIEIPFVGQYTDSMFRGFDITNFIFYDKNTRTVAIFQQTT